LEGCVLKNPMGVYEINTRSKNFIKVKNYKITDIIVEDKEENEKGIKIFGVTADNKLKVNFQFANAVDVTKGSKIRIKYLEKIGGFGGRLTQPTIA